MCSRMRIRFRNRASRIPPAMPSRLRCLQGPADMRIFTIGFTKKSAETFFTRLQRAGVRRLVDVRLNNVSQLAGFTKRDDLRYFTKAICGIEYVHVPELAPTSEILDPYKKRKNGDWILYEQQFLDLMRSRRIE